MGAAGIQNLVEAIEYGGTRYAEIIRADARVTKNDVLFTQGVVISVRPARARDRVRRGATHYHQPFSRRIDDLQQMFVVQRGIVAVELYADDGSKLREVILHVGDAIVLIHGVHAIRVIEDMQCISVKQGPFLGPDYDKVNVKVRRNDPGLRDRTSATAEIEGVMAALKRG